MLHQAFSVSSPGNNISVSCRKNISDADLFNWHMKLGHPSFNVLKQVLSYCNVSVPSSLNFVCEACQKGK